MEPTTDSPPSCRIECGVGHSVTAEVGTAFDEDIRRRLQTYSDVLADVSVWDVHTHIGCDTDTRHMNAVEAVADLDAIGVDKAAVFPMNDPNQGSCFEHPNDLIWSAYQRFPDRLIPFFRLNPNFPSWDEYRRRVEQGFRGIKLHPRSQAFRIAQPEAVQIYEWAEADGLPVLLHTGKGSERVVDDVRRVIDRFPSLHLILGHSALEELPECCAHCGNCDWVLFDTSTLKKEQLLELFRRTEPEKIVYGSDMPFTDLGAGLALVLEAADESGLSRDELALVLGGNLRRWLDAVPMERGECALRSGRSNAVHRTSGGIHAFGSSRRAS